MNILIIGNLGYIGPMLTEHLHKEHPDSKIYGYDIGYFQGNVSTSEGLLPDSLLERQYFGDVRHFDETILKNIDSVIYLAAISNDPMGKEFENPTYDINEKCAVSIAGQAKKAGVKHFVFASSCSVYGLADVNAKDEDSEINPLTAYARSKTNCEKQLAPLAGDDFYITCLRFATACGISYRLRLDLVLNDFVASALTTGKIEILSDGKPWRPLINVKDMARAMDWAIQRKNGGSYLVVNAGADNWNYQVIDLAKAVQRVLGGVEIFVNPNAQPDNRSYKVNFGRFAKLAEGFTPQYDLDTTILELAEGLKSIGFNDPNFRSSHFIRLRTLNNLIKAGKIDRQLQVIR